MRYAMGLAQKIYTTAIALANLDLEIAQVKQAIDDLEAVAKASAAFDPNLKNEKQRSGYLWKSLQDNPRYGELLTEATHQQYQKNTLLAELELYRNQLSISKLAQRQRIVNQLATLEHTDLAA